MITTGLAVILVLIASTHGANGFCATKADGVYPVSECSSSFVNCRNGQDERRDCSFGLYFNPTTTQCDKKSNILGCKVAFDCTDRPDGLYSSGCTPTFWFCSGGVAAQSSCPPGQYFDNAKKLCAYESTLPNCTAGESIKTTDQHTRQVQIARGLQSSRFAKRGRTSRKEHVRATPSPSPLSQNCDSKADGVYGIASCLPVFYFCFAGRATVDSCKLGFFFNENTKYCETPSEDFCFHLVDANAERICETVVSHSSDAAAESQYSDSVGATTTAIPAEDVPETTPVYQTSPSPAPGPIFIPKPVPGPRSTTTTAAPNLDASYGIPPGPFQLVPDEDVPVTSTAAPAADDVAVPLTSTEATPIPFAFSCPGDGHFALGTCWAVYVECQELVPHLLQCPGGFVFNDKFGACTDGCDEVTTGPIELSPAQPTSLPSIYGYPAGTTTSTQEPGLDQPLYGYQPAQETTQAPSVYGYPADDVPQQTQSPLYGNPSDDVPQQPEPYQNPYSASTSTPLVGDDYVPIQEATTATSPYGQVLKCVSDGFFALNDMCSSYYISCYAGVAAVKYCGETTVFNPYTQTCSVDCNSGTPLAQDEPSYATSAPIRRPKRPPHYFHVPLPEQVAAAFYQSFHERFAGEQSREPLVNPWDSIKAPKRAQTDHFARYDQPEHPLESAFGIPSYTKKKNNNNKPPQGPPPSSGGGYGYGYQPRQAEPPRSDDDLWRRKRSTANSTVVCHIKKEAYRPSLYRNSDEEEAIVTTTATAIAPVVATNSTATAFRCESDVDGFYSSTPCSAVYYGCSNGFRVELSCPLRTVFDPVKLYCQHPHEVNGCVAAVKNADPRCEYSVHSTVALGPCQTQFLVCGPEGVSFDMFCVKNQLFDHVLNKCVDAAVCGRVEPTTTTTTELPVTSVTVDAQMQQDSPFVSISACSNQPSGTKLPTGECRSLFVECSDGSVIEQTCKHAGLVFSEPLQTCVARSSVPECSYADERLFKNPIDADADEDEFCNRRIDGYYRHPANCSRVIQCFGQSVIEHPSCTQSLVFNEASHLCDYPRNVPSCRGFADSASTSTKTDCTHGEFIPSTDTCSAFYRCVWGQLVLQDCPDKTYFNPDLNVCDYPENVNCKL